MAGTQEIRTAVSVTEVAPYCGGVLIVNDEAGTTYLPAGSEWSVVAAEAAALEADVAAEDAAFEAQF